MCEQIMAIPCPLSGISSEVDRPMMLRTDKMDKVWLGFGKEVTLLLGGDRKH